MAYLLAQPRATSLPRDSLCKAASMSSCDPAAMIKYMLESIEHPQLSEELMNQIAQNRYHGSELLDIMIGNFGELPISQKALETAIITCGVDALSLVDRLFSHAKEQNVTDELLIAGAASSLEVMEYLMRRRGSFYFTEQLKMAPFLKREHYSIFRNEVLHMLIAQPGRAPVSEYVLEVAAAKADNDTPGMLLEHTEF